MYFKRGVLVDSSEGMHRNWACRKFIQTQLVSLCLRHFFFLAGMSSEILGIENCPFGSQSLLELPLGPVLSSPPHQYYTVRKEGCKTRAFLRSPFTVLWLVFLGFSATNIQKRCGSHKLSHRKRETSSVRGKKENKRLHSRVRSQLISSHCREYNKKEKNITGWELYWTHKKQHRQL